jgi:hypothetical protein
VFSFAREANIPCTSTAQRGNRRPFRVTARSTISLRRSAGLLRSRSRKPPNHPDRRLVQRPYRNEYSPRASVLVRLGDDVLAIVFAKFRRPEARQPSCPPRQIPLDCATLRNPRIKQGFWLDRPDCPLSCSYRASGLCCACRWRIASAFACHCRASGVRLSLTSSTA